MPLHAALPFPVDASKLVMPGTSSLFATSWFVSLTLLRSFRFSRADTTVINYSHPFPEGWSFEVHSRRRALELSDDPVATLFDGGETLIVKVSRIRLQRFMNHT